MIFRLACREVKVLGGRGWNASHCIQIFFYYGLVNFTSYFFWFKACMCCTTSHQTLCICMYNVYWMSKLLRHNCKQNFGASFALNLSLPAPSAKENLRAGLRFPSHMLSANTWARFISVRGAVFETTSRCLSNLAQTSQVIINHGNVSCITQRWFAASGL